VDTTTDRLQELYRQRDNVQAPNKTRALFGLGESESTTKKVAEINKEINALKMRIQYEDYSADLDKKREQDRLQSVSATARLESIVLNTLMVLLVHKKH
jgi:hypothetical protein